MSTEVSKSFFRKEDGSLSVEAVLAIPMLVWAIVATFVFWDAFRTLNTSQKATYTIADMLSREADGINFQYLTAVHELYDFLSVSDGDNALRVTVIEMIEDEDTGVRAMNMMWSEGVGGITGYDDLTPIQARIPMMSPGDQLIVVETEQEWSPSFAVGLTSYRFRELALARPRFAPQLVFNAS